MGEVALIIIYNHQYNKNIDILENLYKDRFTNIYHLIPFYKGKKPNVIPVYENSYYFQGYVSQGFKSYFEEKYIHYFFIADDLILNPLVNENNYFEYLKLTPRHNFLPEFIPLHGTEGWWKRVGEAYQWNIKQAGIEVKNLLPTYDEAMKKFHHFGLKIEPLGYDQISKLPISFINHLRAMKNGYFIKQISETAKCLKNKILRKNFSLPYPFVGSYSDIFVISADTIELFSHYCGVFAATKLFVEVGLPTSLVLSTNNIVLENDIKLKGKALWTKKDYKELKKYHKSLHILLNNFPENQLYIHPVKLSQWDTKL